jgi:CheY-like chemotaxis protein
LKSANPIKKQKSIHNQFNNKNKRKSDFNVQDFLKIDLSKIEKVDQRNIYNLNIKNFNINANNIAFQKSNTTNVLNNNELLDENFTNIIIVDDEVFTRQSTVRILNTVSKTLNVKINIIEAEDGLELIYLIFKCVTQGVSISMILSDENMNFMNGSRSSEILKEILTKKKITDIPFYLVTAYDNNLIEKFISPSIDQVLSKPLTKEVAKGLLINAKQNNL